MIRRLLLIATLGVMLSGCFMAPLALIGPAASGFSTASIIQSGVTTGANYMVKKSTGKTITEHAIASLNKDIMQQTYMPKTELSEKCRKYDFYCKPWVNHITVKEKVSFYSFKTWYNMDNLLRTYI